MRWRPVEVRYMPTEDLGRPLSSLGLDSDAGKNHIEFLKIPELREAQWYHDKSVPIPKTHEHEAPQTKIKQLRGKMVRFETSLKGEISVFEREVGTGIDVLVRSEAGDEMELFNHPETSGLLEAIISDGFVSLHFE